jgi:hypothetical protein
MASPNKWSYILQVVNDALSADPTLQVLKALNRNVQPSPNRLLVYPFLVGGNQASSNEANRATDGTMTVRIWTDVAVPLEGASPTGKSFEAFAKALSMIESAVSAVEVPQQETHADGTTTVIYGFNVTLFGGHVDNGDTKIEADCDVTVSFRSFR